MAERIVFYFDFVSPFAHVGARAIEVLAQKLDREVEWRPVLIGITILKIMGMQPLPKTPLKGPYLARDLQREAEWFGVSMRPHGLSGINSVLACRAFLWLARHDPPRAKPFAQAVFARLWQEGKDITQAEAVLALIAGVGGDGARVRDYLLDEVSKVALREAVDEAVGLGVFGVPTFIADGEMFWGNDHLWMLEHWVKFRRFS